MELLELLNNLDNCLCNLDIQIKNLMEIRNTINRLKWTIDPNSKKVRSNHIECDTVDLSFLDTYENQG